MDDSGLLAEGDALAKIKKLLSVVPQIITSDLSVGSTGPQVQLVQLYLLFYSTGQARENLAAASATGYYGSITEAAILEYQENQNILETGEYDAQTRKEMTQ